MFISQFNIIAVAPGWSLVDYALQIPWISLCFVSGLKNECALISDLNIYIYSKQCISRTLTFNLIEQIYFYFLKETNTT